MPRGRKKVDEKPVEVQIEPTATPIDRSLQLLVYHYFLELNNEKCHVPNDDLQYRAKKFVEDWKRYRAALKDFEEVS